VYGGAFGPIVRPVASAATAARKLAGGVRCAHWPSAPPQLSGRPCGQPLPPRLPGPRVVPV